MDIKDLLSRFDGVTGGGGQYMAKCPVHGDRKASLSIGVGQDGRTLIKCHAGCDTEDIVDALGLSMKDLFVELKPGEVFPSYGTPTRSPVAAIYEFRDNRDRLVAQKLRREDKSFTWRRPDGHGGWIYNRKGIPHMLYRTGPLEGAVFVAEGEKDADTLHSLGYVSASGADGAGPGKWRKEYTEQLKGVHVCVFQDNDPVGKEYAAETCDALHGVAASVRLLDLSKVWPEIPEHGDVTDMVEALGPEKAVEKIAELVRITNEWEPATGIISAVELQDKDMPPVEFIVDGLLPHGLNILAAPSKYGKSWMVLALCLAVAVGDPFLGRKTHRCECLYLALEDGHRRLKGRMNRLLGGRRAPEGVHFATNASPLDNGLTDELGSILAAHPKIKLVVIDTLQKVRGAVHGKEGAYANDYREIGALKAFADERDISLLLVHHLRKMRDDGDTFNMISGTNGIMGAADTTMVLVKAKRGDENATLSVVGRDVESSDTVLRFCPETCRWEAIGDAEWVEEQRARREYQDSPIVQTVKKLLEQSPEGWTGTAQQLLDAGRWIVRKNLAFSARDLSSKLRDLGAPLLDYDGIVHERRANGSGGGKHSFSYGCNGTNGINGCNGINDGV